MCQWMSYNMYNYSSYSYNMRNNISTTSVFLPQVTWAQSHLMREHVTHVIMMTSSNGNIFRVTGLCVGIHRSRWIPHTKASDAELWCFLNKRLSKQPWGWWFEPPSWSLWRHRNDIFTHWWIICSHDFGENVLFINQWDTFELEISQLQSLPDYPCWVAEHHWYTALLEISETQILMVTGC